MHEDIARLRELLAMIGELGVMAADTSAYPAVALQAPDPNHFDAILEAAVKRF